MNQPLEITTNLDNCFSKLNEFSSSLMKGIETFCDKTIWEITEDITLKSATEKEEFEQIERAIQENEESTKRLLRYLETQTPNITQETKSKENEKG